MLEKKLSQSAVDRAKPRSKVYRIADGGGLALQVMPKHMGGGRYFVYRYRVLRRQRMMIIDSADVLDLKTAREEWEKHRAVVRAGGDPVKARKLARLKRSGDELQTFGSVSSEWLARNKDTWSASHYRRNQSLLDRVLLPELGPLPVSQIELAALLGALRKVEERSAITARKAKTVAAKIFDYAVGSGRAVENPARKIVGEQLKAKPAVQHRKALSMDQLAVALRNMASSGIRPVTQAALMAMLFTGLRDYSLRGAKWSQVDLTNKLWTIPAERMKGRKDRKRAFVVPLPKQLVKLLRDLAPLTHKGDDSFVFPNQSRRQSCMSGKAISYALRTLSGVADCHPHGIRTMIANFGHENQFPAEVIELQLSHTLGVISKSPRRSYGGSRSCSQASIPQLAAARSSSEADASLGRHTERTAGRQAAAADRCKQRREA